MPRLYTRRRFLKTSSLTVGAAWSAGAPALLRGKSPNEKLGIAVIGAGNRGKQNLLAMRGERIVALCDADERQVADTRKWIPWAKFYTDFRRLFDRKDIDAVLISTPDHTHAPATMIALDAGKHVYCEKPLAHSVYETRKVTEKAAKTNVATQMGIQMHQSGTYRNVVEQIRAGAIGRVTEVHVWRSGGYAPGDRPKKSPPVPKGLHYDQWLGPAPYRPYHPAYLPRKWRGWWDFGEGLLGDFGCHLMDLPYWALELGHVGRIEAEGPPVHPESTPRWMIVRYDYPERDGRPPVRLIWHNGRKLRLPFAGEPFADWEMGIVFVGEKGRLAADYNRYIMLDKEGAEGTHKPHAFLPDAVRHHHEWIECCKTGRKPSASFDYAGPLTEAVLLGNIAYRLGKPIAWDAEKLEVPNEPRAKELIRPPYRDGWTLGRVLE